MNAWLVSEGAPTAYGGRTVKIQRYSPGLPWTCALCGDKRQTACSSPRCPAVTKPGCG